MAEGPVLETHANHANAAVAPVVVDEPAAPRDDSALKRLLFFVALVLASSGIVYAVVRATLLRAPTDPTTERIQQLIDEANRLLAQLDEKKAES